MNLMEYITIKTEKDQRRFKEETARQERLKKFKEKEGLEK